jgi:hypothetical protein
MLCEEWSGVEYEYSTKTDTALELAPALQYDLRLMVVSSSATKKMMNSTVKDIVESSHLWLDRRGGEGRAWWDAFLVASEAAKLHDSPIERARLTECAKQDILEIDAHVRRIKSWLSLTGRRWQ